MVVYAHVLIVCEKGVSVQRKRTWNLKPAPVYTDLVVIWAIRPDIKTIVKMMEQDLPHLLCHKAENAEEAVRATELTHRPKALVIYTFCLNEEDGIRVIRLFLSRLSDCKVLVCNTQDSSWNVKRLAANFPGRITAVTDSKGTSSEGEESTGLTGIREFLSGL